MKFKQLNEDQKISNALVEYLDYIVDNIGEKKAEQSIKKNLPFWVKGFIFVLQTFKKNMDIMVPIRDAVSDPNNEMNTYDFWVEIFNNVCKQNHIETFAKARGLTESIVEPYEALQAWDFLVDNEDGKKIVKTLISGLQEREPAMASFMEQIYNDMSTEELLEVFRNFVDENPDDMIWSIVWMIKKFGLEKEYKRLYAQRIFYETPRTKKVLPPSSEG